MDMKCKIILYKQVIFATNCFSDYKRDCFISLIYKIYEMSL